jgi:hypothetical protein
VVQTTAQQQQQRVSMLPVPWARYFAVWEGWMGVVWKLVQLTARLLQEVLMLPVQYFAEQAGWMGVGRVMDRTMEQQL